MEICKKLSSVHCTTNACLNKNNNVDIKFECTTHFWNNLHQVHSKSKDWKTK